MASWRAATAQLNRSTIGANVGLTDEGLLRRARISEANVVLFFVLGYAWHRQFWYVQIHMYIYINIYLISQFEGICSNE